MNDEQLKLYHRHMDALAVSDRARGRKYFTYVYALLCAYVKSGGKPDDPYTEAVEQLLLMEDPDAKYQNATAGAVCSGVKSFQNYLRNHRRAQAKKVFCGTSLLYETPLTFIEILATRIAKGIEPGKPMDGGAAALKRNLSNERAN